MTVNEIQRLMGHERPTPAIGRHAKGREFKIPQEAVKLLSLGKRLEELLAERIRELVN